MFLDNKKRFRAFTVIDDYNREALHVEIDFSLPANRIVWGLNHLINRRSKPDQAQKLGIKLELSYKKSPVKISTGLVA